MSKMDKIVAYLKKFYEKRQEGARGFYISVSNAVWSDIFVSFEELEQGKLPLNEGWLKSADIYHSIFTFRTGEGRKAENAIPKTSYLVFDIEKSGHEEASNEEIQKVAKELIEYFEKRGIDVAIKLSGRGIHLYIAVELDLNKKEHFELYKNIREYINAILPQGWHSDNINDFARVVRVPYSRNMKNNKLVLWFNKDISELREIEFEKLWEIYQELKELHEKEQRAKRETEKEFTEDGVLEFDELKLDELAKELALLWKDYWVTGVRHYLSLTLAGFIRKNTALNEEQAVELFSKFIQLVGDEEEKDRIRAVSDTYSKREIASVSILIRKGDDNKYELTGVGKTLASVLRVSDEEMVERLVKLFEDTLELMRKYSVAKLKRSLIGRVWIKKGKTKMVAIEVYRDRVVVATYKRFPDTLERVEEEVVINASLRLLDARLLISDNEQQALFTLKVSNDKLKNILIEQKDIEEIAKTLIKVGVSLAKNKSELVRVVQATIFILMKAFNIEFDYIHTAFDVWFDERYYITNAYINPETNSIIDVDKYIRTAQLSDFVKFIEILNDISDDGLLLAFSGQIMSTPFTFETQLKPLLWLWSYSPGIGKSTLTSKLLRRLFLIEPKTQDALGSEHTIYRFLRMTENRLPVVIDDVTSIPASFAGILKSYGTGNEYFYRGTGNIRKDIKFRTRATLIITANSPFRAGDDAVMSRIINVHIQDYIFKHSDTTKLIKEIPYGLGYAVYGLIVDEMNRRGRRFSDYVELFANTITADIDYRRKLIWGQLLTGFSLLYSVVKRIYDETGIPELGDFIRRAERILNEDYNKIIEEFDVRSTDDEIVVEAVEKLIANANLFDKDKKSVFITIEDFALLKRSYEPLANFTSLWALQKQLEKLASDYGIKDRVAYRTTIQAGVRTVGVIKINIEAFKELKKKVEQASWDELDWEIHEIISEVM
ncbi:primase-helicase family protein [Thermococcus sp. GR6]|uniref:primase-helicase family protein n=1 Tax=Thermococcus sp. GR6 TaxID=1638256 RepID=UPI001430B95F|nr:primase-helicase family protein [Thermococcus sp. GR6]NJE41849.1 hypothetical protein [Thermococcus sp. GR6]